MTSEHQNGTTMDHVKEDETEVKSAPEDETKDSPAKINPATRTVEDDKDEQEGSEDEEEEDEESSDEELPLGSVEAPVQIMTGKRERKKVERLVIEELKPKTPEKKFEVPVGRGVQLGDMELIAYELNKSTADVLKPLYKFLFGKSTRETREIKKHIRLFNGFPFEKDDPEYAKREAVLVKFTMLGLKEVCTFLDVEKKGTKDVVMEKIMEFCMNPQPSGRKPPEKGKKKKGPKKTAVKRKRKSKSDGEKSEGEKSAKKKKKYKKKKAAAGGDASMISEDGNEADTDELDTTAEDGTEESGVEKMDTADTEEETEPKPKKVKTKSTPKPKKEKTPKEKTKTPKKKPSAKSPTKQQKKDSPTKTPSKKTPQKRKTEETYESDSSDDEPLLKKTKSPPSDKELTETIKGILKGANLEEVTMKMVCRKVYDTYPDFSLSHKKDFIKTTVKEIIS